MRIIRRGAAEIPLMKINKNGLFLQPFIKEKVLLNDENIIILITGRPGVGKSNVTLYLGESLVPYGFTFPPDLSYVGEGTDEFINILETNPPKGGVIAYEEAPVGQDSRTWGSEDNKDMNDLLQTFRHRNLVLIMNGVNMSDLDKKTRKLVHLKIDLIRKNKKKGLVYGKVYWVSYDDRTGKSMFSYIRAGGERIDTCYFPKCSKEAWKVYSAKKKAWNDKRIAEIKTRRDGVTNAKRGVDLTPIIEAAKKDKDKYNSIAKIAAGFNITFRQAEKVKANIVLGI